VNFASALGMPIRIGAAGAIAAILICLLVLLGGADTLLK